MDFGIAGKTALLMSSTRGLGFGCAAALVAEGVRVVINGRSTGRGVDAISRLGGKAHFIQADVSKPAERARLFEEARRTQRRRAVVRSDEDVLTRRLVELASCYGRYGYRRVTALLVPEGWGVNHKRVERIWRREGLKVPRRQPKRGRLRLADGSCIRLRPTHRDHVWSYDFILCTARTLRGPHD